jgi:hypothetical protein
MQLIEDWDAVLKKAWSVKFNFAATVLGGLEVGVQFIEPAGVPKGIFAAFAATVSVLAIWARVMAQKELTNASATEPQ